MSADTRKAGRTQGTRRRGGASEKSRTEMAEARPRKRFFLDMFTRDISIEECLLDLIDNAVDSFLVRTRRNIVSELLTSKPARRAKALSEIRVEATRNKIVVTDNCGGIPLDRALSDVFCFGHPEEHGGGRLGVYGVGLKRAIFKIGNSVEMRSQTTKDGFRVSLNVNEWAKRDSTMADWRIPVQIGMAARTPAEAGTHIEFNDIRDEVRMRLKNSAFEPALLRAVAQAYSFFLERYIRVIVNGKTLKPGWNPLGISKDIKPARKSMTEGDVRMQFFAGIAPKKEWKQENAGWYVLCNGRVVVAAEKTELTGWGAPLLPSFHSKFLGFAGVALLESDNPLALPWSTTKRGLNRESRVYQSALRQMVAVSRPVLTFLSRMYPSDPAEAPEERQAAAGVKATQLASLADIDPGPFQAKTRRKTKDTVRVQYDARSKDLDRVRAHVRDPKLSANKIGQMTFQHYLDMECPK